MSAETAPQPRSPAPLRIAGAYAPPAGGLDEMAGGDGRVRPLWRPLVDDLDRLGAEETATRFGRADRYLREAGVYYRAYGSAGSDAREWPLAHIPLLISESEWKEVSAGLAERAELLETVLADIYGANRLVGEGLLPPQLIASSPEYLRPLAGARRHAPLLHFIAFELGRGPDGRWWVLGDRTQAPSGAGFALENRMASGRAFPELMTAMNVHRLAGFFRTLRNALLDLAGEHRGAAILTPGQHSETYFEHAYIARYLGLMLLEGDDMAVDGDRLMVRTVDGARPLGVLWRRLNSAFADPLELDPLSRIGTPGLVQAARSGGATVVNALGSGVLETRAFLAFLPAIARRLLGRDLSLPHIATWWCGGEREREEALARLDGLLVGPAHATAPPFEDRETTVEPATLPAGERAALVDKIRSAGAGFVAQESVTLSTMPFYADGRLDPRPVMLRAFAARTPSGWTVMPGGFARVGPAGDTAAIAMRNGGRAADVWIVGDRPVERITLLSDDSDAGSRLAADLPSRAADHLFWIGRYIERADGVARRLRAWHGRIAEAASPENPALVALRDLLRTPDDEEPPAVPPQLIASIDAAAASAGSIRDRFSSDGWLAILDLAKTARRFSDGVQPGDDAARAMTVLLRKLAGFAGLAHENMYHSLGWRFLELGRRLERGLETALTAARLVPADPPAELLDLLVEIGDSVMTYRRLYRVNSGRRATIELIVLDEANPRSILYQLAAMKSEVAALPGSEGGGRHHAVMREALRIYADLATREPREVTPDLLYGVAGALASLSDLIDEAWFR